MAELNAIQFRQTDNTYRDIEETNLSATSLKCLALVNEELNNPVFAEYEEKEIDLFEDEMETRSDETDDGDDNSYEIDTIGSSADENENYDEKRSEPIDEEPQPKRPKRFMTFPTGITISI